MFGLHCLWRWKNGKSGIGMLSYNSYAAYIQCLKLSESACGLFSIRPRWWRVRRNEFQVILVFQTSYRNYIHAIFTPYGILSCACKNHKKRWRFHLCSVDFRGNMGIKTKWANGCVLEILVMCWYSVRLWLVWCSGLEKRNVQKLEFASIRL